MDIFKGLTEEQKKTVIMELQLLATSKHASYAEKLKADPDNEELQILTIAWEYICQNLKVKGYDWS